MRYRKPSVKAMLGITKAKRRLSKATGLSKVTRISNAPKNMKRRVKRKAGYYSTPMKLLRLLERLLK